ncbi:hypothetical protein AB0O07_23195 [Streptomyces sp. NPDC093085]|uniref:hypothetical protein n=1 Tax=Streptomyces sp. NPDC093085 TaxID=3155068 RepID=UPI00344AA5B1
MRTSVENWREGARTGHTYEPNDVTVEMDGLGRQLSELPTGAGAEAPTRAMRTVSVDAEAALAAEPGPYPGSYPASNAYPASGSCPAPGTYPASAPAPSERSERSEHSELSELEPEAPEGPVFVDESGRRSKKLRRAGWVVAAACACYAVTVVAALVGGDSSAPWLPIPGLADKKNPDTVQIQPAPSESPSAGGPSGDPSASPSATDPGDTVVSRNPGTVTTGATGSAPGTTNSPSPTASSPDSGTVPAPGGSPEPGTGSDNGGGTGATGGGNATPSAPATGTSPDPVDSNTPVDPPSGDDAPQAAEGA